MFWMFNDWTDLWMRDLLHHIHSVDPVAADEASWVGDEAADVPGKEHSLHGQDNCTGTTHHHQQVTKHFLLKDIIWKCLKLLITWNFEPETICYRKSDKV